MGRGRQKAKQTKVARKLKYFSPETDLEALQKELSGANKSEDSPYGEIPPATEEDDWEDYR
ncbi:DUF3073 domain-containing protein [Gleimia sp. 6138-11-ORH1]|uniref:DUF3073 domain-containing protein n=1 Tax=Gleimia sp. 6138-11-ORH1 TaxID=2973937 RepID=UPI00216A9783|nr:DUF3073 domain-containing protein [Gleimia sp. 6138-11-ORH1]MCS4484699.1 DUF3073 domain-containing protein [Gleimia sp. 6138-11-ORH1]